MKNHIIRIIAIAMVIIMVVAFAVSCSKKSNRSVTPLQSFTCTISLEYDGMNISADVEHLSNESCTLTVTEPSSLNGVVINWEAGELSVSYMGMNFDIDTEDVPATAFVPHIMEVIETVASSEKLELTEDETGEICLYEGSCDAGSFTAQIDNETGVIRSISIPAYDLQINFSNFQSVQ